MKRFLSSFVAICLSFIMFGCGLTDLIPPDPREDMSNDPITQKWVVTEYSAKGETIVLEEENPVVNAMVYSKLPKFTCEDGVNCVFEINEKEHSGTVSKEDDSYVITFDDTDKCFYGEINEDNELILKNDGSVKIVFRADTVENN